MEVWGLQLYANRASDSKFHGANMGPTWGREDPLDMLAPWTLISGAFSHPELLSDI